MTKPRAVIGLGILGIVALSVWMGIASGPINGIAVFFILTGLLWAVAKTKHWI